MNYQITINAPEGKIPVYNESTQSIDFIDSDIRERVKTYEDALKVLGEERPSYVDDMPKHLAARIKCETILRALNGDHKFHLTEGAWYYPWLKIYLESSTPKEYKIESNPLFLYEGKKYRCALVILPMVMAASLISVLIMILAILMPMSASLAGV